MTKLTQYAFRKDSEQVALDLLGSEIVRRYPNGEEVRAYISAVAPHTGNVKKTADAGIAAKAGVINVGRPRYGHRLMDITTQRKGTFACVTLRGIILQDTEEEIDGPGSVTKALHIDDTLSGLDIDNKHLFITDKKDPNFDPENVEGPLDWRNKPSNSPGYFMY